MTLAVVYEPNVSTFSYEVLPCFSMQPNAQKISSSSEPQCSLRERVEDPVQIENHVKFKNSTPTNLTHDTVLLLAILARPDGDS